MSAKSFSIIVIILSIAVMMSCTQNENEWKGTIEEKDGVILVKNPREPMYEEGILSIHSDLTIGENTEDENYAFNIIGGIEVDDRENIYILDRISTTIKVFNKRGEFLRTFGKTGQGPGEMQRPSFLQITEEEELVIGDPSTRRLIYFSLQGDFLRQTLLAKIGYLADPIRIDSAGNLYVSLVHPPTREGPGFTKFNSDFELLLIITTHEISKVTENREAKVLLPFDCYIVSRNDHVIWGNSKEYLLNVLNPEGKLIRIIKKDHKPLKLNEKDRKYWGEKASRLSLAKMGYKMILPDFFPAFQSFSIDEEGRIFVQTFERHQEQEKSFYSYDVFDSEGKYITKIPIHSFPRVWKNGKFYTIEADKDGFQYVKRYKVTWNY
jgi:hypothetical protein